MKQIGTAFVEKRTFLSDVGPDTPLNFANSIVLTCPPASPCFQVHTHSMTTFRSRRRPSFNKNKFSDELFSIPRECRQTIKAVQSGHYDCNGGTSTAAHAFKR